MKVKDFYQEEEFYIEDMTQSYPFPKAVSKIDEKNLKQIAKDMRVDYINMSMQSNIYSKLDEIKKKYEDKTNVDLGSSFVDTYYIFVIPILFLLSYEMINYKKEGY